MHYIFCKIKILSLFLLLNIIFICPAIVYAQSEEEMQILRMFYSEADLVVTPTRTPKPISQVAENITVVTSKEIENMNAHTVTDVLNTIPGVQVDLRGGPGSAASAYIHGSEFRHVLVIIDGVALNNLSDNFADISAIPVQNIERIEIIKGPASSSWGSSLGGVINIITKPVGQEKNISGTVSASYGERNTGDYRAEASGSAGNVGYYIYAGNMVSNGFVPNTSFYENNLYTKIKWDITNRVNLLFTFGYNKGDRGFGQASEFDISMDNDFEYLLSTLSLNYKVNDEADFELSLRTLRQNTEFFFNQLSTGAELIKNYADESGYGGSAKFRWKKNMHNIVIGTDIDDSELETNTITDKKQSLEKWAVFANDTIAFNKFTVTPGIRYDHTNTNDDFLSPNLGITYQLTEATMLRGYIARGFNIPSLSETFGTGFFSVPNPDLEVEKVWSIQAGMESTALKYLWLKASLFRHDISDALFSEELPDGTFTIINKEKQRRQGFEVEIKTVPVYNTSLFAGFVFIDARDRDTDERLEDTAEYTYDIGITYNDNKSFKALLKGHYIWWNVPDNNGRYSDFIWDINLTKRIHKSGTSDVDLFFTAHNIFNGSQYAFELFRNPQRWIEAGVRLKF